MDISPETAELVRDLRRLDTRYPADARPMQVALAALAALVATTDLPALRSACRRSGGRLAEVATSRARWAQAVRLSSSFLGASSPSGQAVESAAARDAAAVSVARKLVGHLVGTGHVLPPRQTAITRMALAVVAGQELDAARSRGWLGTVAAGPWLAAELGASTPATGKSALDRMVEAKWLVKSRRARTGRAFVYKAANLTAAIDDPFEQHAGTVDALVLGQRGQDALADLILTVRAPGWAYGEQAPGATVWAYAVECAAGTRLGLSAPARRQARAWLTEQGIEVSDLPAWVAQRSLPGGEAQLAKAEAEARREEKSAELAQLTEKHRKRVAAAGQVVRKVCLDLVEHPGRRRSPSALVPRPHAAPDEIAKWLKGFLQRAAQLLPQEQMRLALTPQIAKQIRTAFVEAGHPETRAQTVAEKIESMLLPKAKEGPDSERVAA